jgi:hypothetical protein
MTLVTGSALGHDVHLALSNSFGFGGQNTALLFRRMGRMTDDVQPGAPLPGDEPRADVAAEPAAVAEAVVPPTDDGDIELLRLIDRLAALLDRSDLTELEVESGGTGLVLAQALGARPDLGHEPVGVVGSRGDDDRPDER